MVVVDELNFVLAKLAESHRRFEILHFLYDTAGHVETYRESRLAPGAKEAVLPWVSKTVGCYYYDALGRPRRRVEPNNDSTGTSCQPISDGQGVFEDFFYDKTTGAYRGSRRSEGSNENQRTESRPNWEVTWEYIPEGKQQRTTAFADALRQMYLFATEREIEGVPLPATNSSLPTQQRAEYYFYEPLPLSVMDGNDDPEKVVRRYHRERRLTLVGDAFISEYFVPNGGLRHRIWWRSLDRAVFRHEQFDASGRLVRVINRGFATTSHRFYSESSEYRGLLKQHPHLMHRVYEYDKSGNEKLVAISWYNRDPEAEDPQATSGPSGPVVDMAKGVKRAWTERKKSKAPAEELTQLFGSPDGKLKWKDGDAFTKAFGVFWDVRDLDRLVESRRRAEGLSKGSRAEQ